MAQAIDLEEMRQKAEFEKLMAEKADQPEEESNPVTTAFMVIQQTNGQWLALAEYESLNIVPERQAIMDDIIGGCAAVQGGAQAQQTAMHTVMMMNQQAQQMRAAVESQRIASQLDLSKLHGGK